MQHAISLHLVFYQPGPHNKKKLKIIAHCIRITRLEIQLTVCMITLFSSFLIKKSQPNIKGKKTKTQTSNIQHKYVNLSIDLKETPAPPPNKKKIKTKTKMVMSRTQWRSEKN